MTLSSEIAELGARNALVTLCEVSRHYEPDTHPNIKRLNRIVESTTPASASFAGSYMLQVKPDVKNWYAYMITISRNNMRDEQNLISALEEM
tara:strand:+ start:595 stop:870 length:276 start_codon:yes stop_codon:yes gene_type:complete